jgi:hypothetical protein
MGSKRVGAVMHTLQCNSPRTLAFQLHIAEVRGAGGAVEYELHRCPPFPLLDVMSPDRRDPLLGRMQRN